MALPDLALMKLPDPPAGHGPWRQVGRVEWSTAARLDTPAVYLEWNHGDLEIIAYFVAYPCVGGAKG